MKVKELMTSDVRTCTAEDTLQAAAEIMWENDCGCLPVVDETSRPVFVLTDRDVCMAASLDDRPLQEIPVAVPMGDDPVSNEVWSCGPDDTLVSAASMMRDYKVRRLPVVDSAGVLVGIILSVTWLEKFPEAEKKRPTVDNSRQRISASCWRPSAKLIRSGTYSPHFSLREDRRYTALFSNTARAHELKRTDDWVVVYQEDGAGEDQWTVVTEQIGPMHGQRVVRGREKECLAHYATTKRS